jgi:hypothetical protein
VLAAGLALGMTPQSLEAQVIARVAEDYRRRGYDVDGVPRGARVPEFLGRFSRT